VRESIRKNLVEYAYRSLKGGTNSRSTSASYGEEGYDRKRPPPQTEPEGKGGRVRRKPLQERENT